MDIIKVTCVYNKTIEIPMFTIKYYKNTQTKV